MTVTPLDMHARAQKGDLVVIAGRRVGEHEKVGEVLEVLGEPGHERYRVRWDDGRESVLYPGDDATFRHSERRRPPREGA